jgi:hypothetical protein
MVDGNEGAGGTGSTPPAGGAPAAGTTTLTDPPTKKEGEGGAPAGGGNQPAPVAITQEQVDKFVEALPAEKRAEFSKKLVAAAPEKYTLKLPEKSALDASVTERTTAIARTLGLSTDDAAQKVLDFANQEVATALATTQESLQPGGAVWNKQVEAWQAASLADPELGNGKQETLAAVATKAKAIIEKYASPKVKELLHNSGLGSHPEVVRMFYKIAKAAGEGSLVTGSPAGGGKKSAAEVLYGDSPTTTGVTQ